MQIPLSQPDITQRDIDAVIEVMKSLTLTIGPKLEEFEQICAGIAGRRHGIGVSSGTAALHLALLAAGVEPGDEVITTPYSFVASANSILYCGAKPVFVDIDPVSLNLDLDKVEAAITPRTRAILPVEVFGNPAGMPELEQIAQRRELALIEDCCEGFGGKTGDRPIGSFGRAGAFSFYPNKQITTGEGGMIVTDDDALASACRALRNQGREGQAWLSHERLGYNYRMSELSAALGIAQAQRLEVILHRRREVARQYIERLMTSRYLTLPTIDESTTMSWFVFVVRLNDLFEIGDRDQILIDLRTEGINCAAYFPPIHLQPYMMQAYGHRPGMLPVCEYISARSFALPFFNKMNTNLIERVCDKLEKVLEDHLTRGRKRF